MPSRSAPCVLYCVSVPCACLSAVRVPFAGRSRGMAVSSGRALPRGSQSPRFESPRVELGDRSIGRIVHEVSSLTTASWTVTASVDKARRGADQRARGREYLARQSAGLFPVSRDAKVAPGGANRRTVRWVDACRMVHGPPPPGCRWGRPSSGGKNRLLTKSRNLG